MRRAAGAPRTTARLGYGCVATSQWGPNRPPARRSADGVTFVRRYTVRRETPDGLLRRLALAEAPALGLEGLRQTALHWLRSTVGATRYARWRREALQILGR